MEYDPIFAKIAEALLIDYTSVYYVDAVTNHYRWYSIDPYNHSLQLEADGDDFFESMAKDAKGVIYEEDIHIFTTDFQKDNILTKMTSGDMQSVEYRLVMNGKPVWHSLRLIKNMSEESHYFIFGLRNIDKEVNDRLESERLGKENEFFNQIAHALARQYSTIYYVNIETNNYLEYSSNDEFKELRVPSSGPDFFEESVRNIERIVHPEDREMVLRAFSKEEMLKKLSSENSIKAKYRIRNKGTDIPFRSSVVWAYDGKHLIVGIENISAVIKVQEELANSKLKSFTYGQIASSLASNYDVIYYIDAKDNKFMEFSSQNILQGLEIPKEGDDFFMESKKNITRIIHPEDANRVLGIIDKDYFITALEDTRHFSMDYRMIMQGEYSYMRLTCSWSTDKSHFIVGIENISDEIKKEKEQLAALKDANEKAHKDGLTGISNKNAYEEDERALQKTLDNGKIKEFGIAVCDINDLKKINDHYGHKAGDEYIKSACNTICNLFKHSPVYRYGGDEFIVILTGEDYQSRFDALKMLEEINRKNSDSPSGPVIAIGIADHYPDIDESISEVFERADQLMYINKRLLKEKKN